MENNKVAVKAKDLIALTAQKFKSFVESGALRIPQNYSPETALKIAGMLLADVKNSNGKPALEVCTPESIGNSLLKMVTLGLNPMRHCDFIVYGNQLTCNENYNAKKMIAFRDAGVKSIVSHAVNEGDKFEIAIEAHTGIMSIKSHEKTLKGMSGKVIGAYAIVTMNDNSSQTTVMNIDQIENSWNMRKGEGLTKAHKNFPDEMAIKTVIGRALKPYIKSLDDRALFHNVEAMDKPLEDIKHETQNIDYQEFEEIEEVNTVEASDTVSDESEKDPF